MGLTFPIMVRIKPDDIWNSSQMCLLGSVLFLEFKEFMFGEFLNSHTSISRCSLLHKHLETPSKCERVEIFRGHLRQFQ